MVLLSCVAYPGPTDTGEICRDSPTAYEMTLYRRDLAKHGVTLLRCGYPRPHTSCTARASICQGSKNGVTHTYICNGGYTCHEDAGAKYDSDYGVVRLAVLSSG